MARGTYISIDTTLIGEVSAQASALGSGMEDTREELRAMQKELSEVLKLPGDYYGVCWEDTIPTGRLKSQQSKMEEIVSLLAQAEQLAQDADNKLNTETNALKLAVAAMGGLAGAVYTTAVSLITRGLTGETDCGDDWAYVGEPFTPRIKAPTKKDAYYGSKATTANCTTYAANRAREILQNKDITFSGNAKEWWKYRNNFAGYSTKASEPRIGALMIWGKAGYSGPGHVAVVEDIIYNKDGSVKTVIYSESSYGGLWYSGKGKQYCGQYNWYGNATSYWGCTGQTPKQIEKVTQEWNDETAEMGFVGYIYLQ